MITPEVLQKYAKQIKQAKLEEFRSFLDFTDEVRDRRKHKIENFVIGRWVLTIKNDKDGQFKKFFKLDGYAEVFRMRRNGIFKRIHPQLLAMVSALPHSMPRLCFGIFCILTLKPGFFRGKLLRLRTPRNPRSTSIGHWFTTLSCWFVYSFGLRLSRCT